MKSNFKKFMDKKEQALEELQGNHLDYDMECRMFGTRAASTRQPPSYHAMINVLNEYIPLTSKAEILHMAISDAFSTFMGDLNDEVREQVLAKFEEEHSLTVGLIAPVTGTEKSAVTVSEEMKAHCLKVEEERGEDK